jgi:hypothetical protein
VFEQAFGLEALTRQAQPTVLASQEQKRKIRALIEQIGMRPEQVSERLAAYGAAGLDDLMHDSARIILHKLETALAAKSEGTHPQKEE